MVRFLGFPCARWFEEQPQNLLNNEVNIRMIGYGGMLMEYFVAHYGIGLSQQFFNRGVYFAINAPAAVIG